MRGVLITFCAIELISAGLQLNDSDPVLWVLIYLLPFFLNLIYLNNHYIRRVNLTVLIVYVLFFLSYVPGIIDWAMKGFPSIVTTMQAETPHVELVREGGGLLILVINLLLLLRPISSSDKSSRTA